MSNYSLIEYIVISSVSIIKLQKLPLIVSFFEGNVPFAPLSSFSSEILFPTLSLHHSMSSLTLLVSLNSFEIRTVPFSPEIKKCRKCYCKKFDVFDMLCVAIKNSMKLFTRQKINDNFVMLRNAIFIISGYYNKNDVEVCIIEKLLRTVNGQFRLCFPREHVFASPPLHYKILIYSRHHD